MAIITPTLKSGMLVKSKMITTEVAFTSKKHCILNRCVCVCATTGLWFHYATEDVSPCFHPHQRPNVTALSPTLLAVASLFVAGGNAPLDFGVARRLAVELAAGPWFGQR